MKEVYPVNTTTPEENSKKNGLTRRKFLSKAVQFAAGAVLGVSGVTCEDKTTIEKNKSLKDVVFKKSLLSILNFYDSSTAGYREDVRNALLLSDPNIVSKIEKLMQSTDENSRFLACQALSFFADDQKYRKNVLVSLESALNDKSVTLRIMSANILLYNKQAIAIPTLIAGLDSRYQELSMISEPPLPLPEYSHLTLTMHTVMDFGYDQQKWQDWWQKNKNKLYWNEKKQAFTVQ